LGEKVVVKTKTTKKQGAEEKKLKEKKHIKQKVRY